MRLIILLMLFPIMGSAQYSFKRLIPSASLFYVAGMASGVADICSTPAKYNESAFKKWNPEFTYGEYWGHKDETWVNKWRMGPDGLEVGKEKFFGSSSFLVGATDAWHGNRSVMLVGFKAGALTYKKPQRWWYYALDFAVLSVAYSAGWWTSNLAFR